MYSNHNPELVVYELEFVQEIMRFLNEVGSDKSKELLRRMICPKPHKPLSEEELQIRCMTDSERRALLYGASFPKDSSTLKTLSKLCEPRKKAKGRVNCSKQKRISHARKAIRNYDKSR